MNLPTTKRQPREYRQGARAEAAAETHRRIIGAFLEHARERWFDEITLDDVARDAEVTVQTVIRRFRNKQGLLEAAAHQLGSEILARRVSAPGDVRAAVEALVNDYEITGDLVFRLLAQEARQPALTTLLSYGRGKHRAWVAEVFAHWLAPLQPRQREVTLSALVAAFDVYVWKLLRRDLGHSVADVATIMHDLATGLLGRAGPVKPK
jgi:AcrR family transcriptional regulator